ncbi:cysteine-rich DPF motif domain-containing protein 1 [Echinops telfairi]|uniref:Cysteine-rich DPF motif domain-containing protein 1 n=1 Tax=Echinops telfairi TaxID=9371 RepID=A0AC55D0T4_ECHTE|nr:cysteine-rich DPF motif domain-containing protein 1 [Echinops telfairi]
MTTETPGSDHPQGDTQMASETEHLPLGVFECHLCALSAPYSYVGQKPPNTRSVFLLEESYVLKDPFAANKDKFLVLGSRCNVCSRLVCVGPVSWRFEAGHPHWWP